MSEPTQEEVYRLCGIEQPEWHMDPKERGQYVGREAEPFGAAVALRWIGLLDGRPYTRRSDGLHDIYTSGDSWLRVRIG